MSVHTYIHIYLVLLSSSDDDDHVAMYICKVFVVHFLKLNVISGSSDRAMHNGCHLFAKISFHNSLP